MDNKEKIMSIAVNLFASRGYDAVGIQEIVDSAGITKPTLYYYFESKKGLLKAISKQYFGILNQQVEIVADYQHDITLTLTNIMKSMFKFANENIDFYRMQLGMNFSSPDNEANKIIKLENEKLFHIVENVFKKSAEDHGNMKSRQSAYAATFIGMINTYIGLFLNRYIKLDEKTIYQALHQFMHGIFS
jgi:TetR/AcrR family transcriptional regulator